MELVTVTTVSDAGLANVVVGVLEQAGVEAVVGGPGAPDVYPMPSVHPFHILVNEGDLYAGARRPRPVRDRARRRRRRRLTRGRAPGVCYHVPSCSVFSALRGVPDTGVTMFGRIFGRGKDDRTRPSAQSAAAPSLPANGHRRSSTSTATSASSVLCADRPTRARASPSPPRPRRPTTGACARRAVRRATRSSRSRSPSPRRRRVTLTPRATPSGRRSKTRTPRSRPARPSWRTRRPSGRSLPAGSRRLGNGGVADAGARLAHRRFVRAGRAHLGRDPGGVRRRDGSAARGRIRRRSGADRLADARAARRPGTEPAARPSSRGRRGRGGSAGRSPPTSRPCRTRPSRGGSRREPDAQAPAARHSAVSPTVFEDTQPIDVISDEMTAADEAEDQSTGEIAAADAAAAVAAGGGALAGRGARRGARRPVGAPRPRPRRRRSRSCSAASTCST